MHGPSPDPPAPSGARDETSSDGVFAIGLAGNLGLAGLKLAVGFWAGSRALIADGWHSSADLATNGGVWLAHRWAKAPPDDDHHYGHGNAEPLAGFLVGIVLLIGGLGVLWKALTAEVQLREGSAFWAALGVAALSMLVNLGLAWMTWREGHRTGSHGLLALARDNASDVLSSLLVLVGIAVGSMGYDWAETVAALMIGGLIVSMGWASARSGLDVLMDAAPDPALRRALRELALRTDSVRGVQSVRVHPVGATERVDMEISVDGRLTVDQGHEIAHDVEDAVLREHPSVREVHVHVNPWTAASDAGARVEANAAEPEA